ncbi:MAG: cation-translocating P-type ATPase [Planctomycetota bacterium]|nr:MAG: cation-translocating P-type ATPase [Planctomycetota bacterium]
MTSDAGTRGAIDDAPERTSILPLAGMTCEACARSVEAMLRAVPGVASAEVSFGARQVTVRGASERPSRAALAAALRGSGYSIPDGTDAAPGGDLRAEVAFATAAEGAELARSRRALAIALAFGVPALLLELFAADARIVLAVSLPVLAWAGAELVATGLRAALRGRPDMNTLIALGAVSAWLAGALGAFGPAGLHAAAHHAHAAALIVIFALLGRWLEQRTRRRAGDALAALVELTPQRVRVLRRGAEVELPLSEARVGALALVRPGERIPVDGVVHGGASEIDESALTGESRPRAVEPGARVSAGTLNGSGALEIAIERIGSDTRVALIAQAVQRARGSRVALQRLVDRVSAVFVPFVLVAALATLVGWRTAGGEWDAAIGRAIAVLVVACPCALGLATPAAIVAATSAAARIGALVRGADALERLARVDHVVLDKTGTLTSGAPVLVAVHALDARAQDERELLRIAASVESSSEQPLGRALVAAARERALELAPVSGFRAEPGRGVRATLGGREVWLGSPQAAERRLEAAAARELVRATAAIAARGASPVALLVDGAPRALFELRDAPRPQARAVIEELGALGLSVELCSGDHPGAVAAIAGALGIERARGAATPEDKLELVRARRAEGRRVWMIGDGVNDAPALAAADVGLAIGGGADVALEAADAALLEPDLARLPRLLRLARAMRATIRANLAWAFAYNVLALPLAAGALEPWTQWSPSPGVAAAGMAASSLVVVLNSLRLLRAS